MNVYIYIYIQCDNKIKRSPSNDWYQSIDNCVVKFNGASHLLFFSPLIYSLSKIIISMDVKMHLIFVTLTHRFRGEELKGRLMHGEMKRRKNLFLFLLLRNFIFRTPSPCNKDMKY